jgi:hypothetical protein
VNYPNSLPGNEIRRINDLSVDHCHAGAVDQQSGDVLGAVGLDNRRAGQRNGAGVRAGLADRLQDRIGAGHRRGIEVVPGQRKLGEDDQPRPGFADDPRARNRVRDDVIGHHCRLSRGCAQPFLPGVSYRGFWPDRIGGGR